VQLLLQHGLCGVVLKWWWGWCSSSELAGAGAESQGSVHCTAVGNAIGCGAFRLTMVLQHSLQ
jgi:hypothetical protein